MKILKPIKSKIKTYNIIGFDVETYSKLNLFLMGCLYYNNNKYDVFYNKEKFISKLLDLCSRYKKNIIVATNLGFDINALFEDTPYYNQLKFIVRGSDIIKVELRKNKSKSLTFIDTFNFAQYSVNTLGKILKLPKLNKPKCLGDIPKNDKDFKELEIYNIRDAEISKKFIDFVQHFFNNSLNTELKTTISSSSMDCYKRNYLEHNIRTPEKEQLEDFYKAYYGGRTEAFKRGKFSNLYYYDFNSLYPSCYHLDFPNPNSLIFKKKGNKKYLRYEGISNVVMKIKYSQIPFLPYRDSDLGKLIFPTGLIKGWYTNLEIRRALKEGYKIIKIYEMYYYTRTFKPFKKFGSDLYNRRLEFKKQNNPFELPVKIVMNGFYGKWAQKYYNQEIYNLNDLTIDDINNFIKKGNVDIVGDFLYITDKTKEIMNFINPIFSIYITAYARIKLYDAFKKVGFNSVYYCDTDSIITDMEIKENVSNKLGDLKLEYKLKDVIIVKPKLYGFNTFDNKCFIKSKGIPIFKGDKVTLNFFKKVLDNPLIQYDKFVKFKEANRSKAEYKRGKLKVNQIIEINKIIGLEDNKRIWYEKFCYNTQQESKPRII